MFTLHAEQQGRSKINGLVLSKNARAEKPTFYYLYFSY